MNTLLLVEKRAAFREIRYLICYSVVTGYYAVEASKTMRGQIMARCYFDKLAQAEEHAQMEIEGFLNRRLDDEEDLKNGR